MPSTLLRRPGPVGSALTATALALGLALTTGTPAVATTDTDDVPVTGEPCTGSGIDVVVDVPVTEGSAAGEVRLGCSPDVDVSGTEALNAAGFTDTRDAATMICAIDGHPDPCPTEFEGVFWSYWFADTTGDQAGQWQQYMEGSDTTVTQEGRVEGWRYGDGAEGPRVDPLALAAATGGASGEDAAGDEPADEATDQPADEPTAPTGTDEADQDALDEDSEPAAADDGADPDSAPVWPWVVGGAVVLALAALLLRSRRSTADDARTGPDADEV